MSDWTMRTRKQPKLWPVGQTVSKNFKISKSELPTNKDALLGFYTIQICKENQTDNQVKRKQLSKLPLSLQHGEPQLIYSPFKRM